MPTIYVAPEQLLQAALQLSRAEREYFLAQLLLLSISQDTPHLTQAESELLLKINQGLPADIQQRLETLITKRQAQTLTPEEHQELIHLTEASEQSDVERLQHLLALAGLRNLSLDTLMQQLGLHPVLHD